jgi:hypothetical protein
MKFSLGNRLLFSLIFTSLIFGPPLTVSPGRAEEGRGDQLGKEQIDKWSDYYQARAARYRIVLADDGRELAMSRQPVMRWTNLVVSPDITHGECFVWTLDGRPEAFTSLFSYNQGGNRNVAHAWNTFSRHRIVASYDGAEFWTPPGLNADQMNNIPHAAAPADSRAKRLIQMRRLARAFTARSGGTDGDKELELRLLATPVFRHESASEECLDGALFAFVTGTDPEVMLLIEARQVDDAWRWQFLPFRHSHLSLLVRYDSDPVWESRRGSVGRRVPVADRPYLSQHGIDLQPQIFP